MTITIAIAEDHTIVADALATMLSFDEDFEVIATAAGGDEIVDLVNARRPQVVLMDVTLRGLNGIEATREIIESVPETRVVMLTMHDDQETVMASVAAGACGFLPKNVGREELGAAIRAVAGGGGFLHPQVTHPFLQAMSPAAAEALGATALTDREREVLQELAGGKSTKLIAASLVIADETVKRHLAHIYQKLGVSDRAQAVAVAFRRGLVR